MIGAMRAGRISAHTWQDMGRLSQIAQVGAGDRVMIGA
jgi:hypothetical protein